MPNSLNLTLNSLGFNMNGSPNGGYDINYSDLLLKGLLSQALGKSNRIPTGAMTASLHTIAGNKANPGDLTKEATGKGLQAKGFMNSKLGKFGSSYGGVIGDTASALGNMVGKRGLDGLYGSITKEMDAAYDTIQKAAAHFGPYGQLISAGMGVNKLLGNAVSKIGGGTDGVTKTDAILNSAFLNMTPLGLINGFGGKKANTYTRNNELDTQTNGGFQGFLTTQDTTQIGAGKKYGLFSSGARKKQNQLTEFTLNMKHTISGIVDSNTINNLAAQGSTPFVANQLSVDLNGGIQQMRAARHGMQFSRRVVSKYQTGQKLKRSFLSYDVATGKYVDLPTDLTKEQIEGKLPIKLANGSVVFMLKNGTVTSDRWETIGVREHLTPMGLDGLAIEYLKKGGKTSRTIEELISYAKFKNPEFVQRMNNKPIAVYFIDPKSNTPNEKLEGTHYMANEGNYVFPMILPVNGKMTFLGDKAKAEALRTGNYIEFNSPEEAELFATLYKLGWSDFFNLYDLENSIPNLYKQGGQMNVIPEGALHARLHHLDEIDDKFKDVTTKGIPVITEEEGGEIVQHAEIEHSELILNKEVTDKIEELRKDGSNEAAIEAGKLLVQEILHNTDDRTNLIELVV